MSSLTEEGPNDLAEELVRGEAVQVNENVPLEDDVEGWQTWTPDPVDTVSASKYFLRLIFLTLKIKSLNLI